MRDAIKAVAQARGCSPGNKQRTVYERLYSVCKALMKVSRIRHSEDPSAFAAEVTRHAEQQYDYVVSNLE
jgi:hypothetical protein